MATAKLQLGTGGGSPNYSVVRLLDDPPQVNDNQDTDQLREVEVGRDGRIYILNCSCNNDSDILWIYDTDGRPIARRQLQGIGIRAPIGLCVSAHDGSRLYLSSSENRPDANSVAVYVLSTEDLTVSGTIELRNMGHVTDLAEDPTDGTLYAAGFKIPAIPSTSDIQDPQILNKRPFYGPRFAVVPHPGQEDVEAICPSGVALLPDNELALPLSVVWISPTP